MKKLSNFLTPAVLIVLLFTACSKDEGTPPVPVDGLVAYSGKNRAVVEFDVPDGAVRGKVFFNNGDFKEFEITASPQRVIVDGLSEQEHILKVVTMDADGLVSDPKAVRVNVYGDNYKNSLKLRKWIDQITHDANSIELIFDEAFADETAVRVVYVNTAGEKDSLDMPANENSIVVENINTEEDYFYYSIYQPETGAIDSFFSPRLNVKTAMMMDFQKEKWVVSDVSGEAAGNAAEHIVDNDANTSWRSGGGGSSADYITVDMGGPKVIEGFYFNKDRESNAYDLRGVKIEVSADEVEWTPVLETEVTGSFLQQTLPLNESVTARYFKLTVNTRMYPGSSQAGFGEIDAYNTLNESGSNGYSQSSPVALQNAQPPFTADGSNLAPPLGGRMQQLLEWTHSSGSMISFDNTTDAMTLFAVPVWGAPEVKNGKIHQTVTLQPGDYLLKIESGAAQGPAEVFGVITTGSSLPDYATVSTTLNSTQFAYLPDYQDKTTELLLRITEETAVSLGIVYNLYDQFAVTGIPWTSFIIKGFDLQKVE